MGDVEDAAAGSPLRPVSPATQRAHCAHPCDRRQGTGSSVAVAPVGAVWLHACVSDDQQTPEEAEAQAGDGSVGQFVMLWVSAILDSGAWALAMATSTPELRLARAQAWVMNAQRTGQADGFDRDALAASLAAVDESHALWSDYAAAEVQGFREVWGDVGNHLAVGSRPRPLDPDHELVLVVDYRTVPNDEQAHGDHVAKVVDSPTEIAAFPFVVRHYEGGRFLIASHNGPDNMPAPGWPPQL